MSFPVLEPLTLETTLGWIPIRALPALPPPTTLAIAPAPPLTDAAVLAAAAQLGLARSLDEIEEERLIDLPSRVWEQLALLESFQHEGIVRSQNDDYHRLLRACQRPGVYVQEVVIEAGSLRVTGYVSAHLADWLRAELASVFTAGENGALYELTLPVAEPERVADAVAALREAVELVAPIPGQAVHRVRHAADGVRVHTLRPLSTTAQQYLARYQDYHTCAIIHTYPAVRSFIGPFLLERVAPFLTARVHAFLAEIADATDDDDYGTLDNLVNAQQDLLAVGDVGRLVRGAVGEIEVVAVAADTFAVKYRAGHPTFALYETVDLALRSELALFLDAAGYLQVVPLPAGPVAWSFQRLEGFDPAVRENGTDDDETDDDETDDEEAGRDADTETGDAVRTSSITRQLRENIFGFVTPSADTGAWPTTASIPAALASTNLCTMADVLSASDRTAPLQQLAAAALGAVVLLAPSCNSLQERYAALHGWDMAELQQRLVTRYLEFAERGTITYELATAVPADYGGWLLHNVSLYVQRLVIPVTVTVTGPDVATFARALTHPIDQAPATLDGPITVTVTGNFLSLEEALAMQALLVMARRQALQRTPAEELLSLEDGLLPSELFTFLTVPEGQRTTVPAPDRTPRATDHVYFLAQEEVVSPRRLMARVEERDPFASFALVDVRVTGRAHALFSCVTTLPSDELATEVRSLHTVHAAEGRIAATTPFDLPTYHRLFSQLREGTPTRLPASTVRTLMTAAAGELGLLYRSPLDVRPTVASTDYKLELLREGAYFRYRVVEQSAAAPGFSLLVIPRAWVLEEPALLEKIQRTWAHGCFLTPAGRLLYRVAGVIGGASLRPELARFTARRRAHLGPGERALLEEWYEQTRLGV